MDDSDECVSDYPCQNHGNVSNTSNCSSSGCDPVDKFISYHLDTIIDITFDLQDRFRLMNPFFLSKMTSVDLTDFFVDYYLLAQSVDYTFVDSCEMLYDRFIEEYNSEIVLSYDVLSPFVRKCKFSVPLRHWTLFCFQHTDLYEIKSFY